MRLFLMTATLALIVGCGASASNQVDATTQARVTAEIEQQVKAAYDLRKPNVEERLLGLYPDSGRVVSAAGGQVLTSRDSLAAGIRYFWRNVGVNMRGAVWIWDSMLIDVMSPTTAVMTATYHIPHTTPQGQRHTLGGAWTAVFRREGQRWVVVQEHLSDAPQVIADSAHVHPPE